MEYEPSEDTPRQGGLLLASAPDRHTAEDHLGFAPYVRALAQFLLSKGTQGPLTISIEGEWGSGKSSFLLQLERELERRKEGKSITVWFNAWRHHQAEELWAAFAVEFLRQVAGKLSWRERARAYLSLIRRRYNWKKGWFDLARIIVLCIALIVAVVWSLRHGWQWLDKTAAPTLGKWGLIAGTAAAVFEVIKKLKERIGNPFKIDLKKYMKAPDYEQKASFLERFHKDFSKIVKAYAGGRRVFVIIDDLDRCEVPRAAELMQALNLMISGEGEENLFFLLGMDRYKVAAGIAVKHKSLLPYLRQGENIEAARGSNIGWYGLKFGYEFIEKLIQIPVIVPRPGEQEVAEYITSLSPGAVDAFKADAQVALTDSMTPEEESEPMAPAVERLREEFRLKADGDSPELQRVARRVAPALENNPRSGERR